MKNLLVSAFLVLGLAFTSCIGSMSNSEVKVDTWQSPEGTVQLDYLLGHDAGCKAVSSWLDSIKASYKEEDTQVKCKALLIFQNSDYLTYYFNVETLPSEYYEGDSSSRLYTFGRKDGHILKPSDLTEDFDALSKKVLARTRLENDWAIEALGGEEAFLDLVKDFSVGLTPRGLTFCYSVMEGTWQSLCTIPSSEMKVEL